MSRKDDLEMGQKPAKTVEELQKDNLKKKVEDLEKKSEENEKLLRSYEDKAVQYEKKIATLEKELNSSKGTCINLKKQLDDLDRLGQKVRKDHQEEVSKLEAELAKAKKEVKDAKSVPLKLEAEPLALEDAVVEKLMEENEVLIEKKLKEFFSKFAAEFNVDASTTKAEIEKELRASLEAAKKERAVKKAALEKEKKHHEMMLKLREEKAFIDSLIEEEEGKR